MLEQVALNPHREFTLPETLQSVVDTRADLYLTLWLQLDETAGNNDFEFLLWQPHESEDLVQRFNQKLAELNNYSLANALRHWFFPNTELVKTLGGGTYQMPRRLYSVLGHSATSFKSMALKTHERVAHVLKMQAKSFTVFENTSAKNTQISRSFSDHPIPKIPQVKPLPPWQPKPRKRRAAAQSPTQHALGA